MFIIGGFLCGSAIGTQYLTVKHPGTGNPPAEICLSGSENCTLNSAIAPTNEKPSYSYIIVFDPSISGIDYKDHGIPYIQNNALVIDGLYGRSNKVVIRVNSDALRKGFEIHSLGESSIELKGLYL